MSNQIQVLLIAADFPEVLTKIKNKQKFGCCLIAGSYELGQFAKINIDLSEWEVTEFHRDDRQQNVTRVDQQSYDCFMVPIQQRTETTERQLDPNL